MNISIYYRNLHAEIQENNPTHTTTSSNRKDNKTQRGNRRKRESKQVLKYRNVLHKDIYLFMAPKVNMLYKFNFVS